MSNVMIERFPEQPIPVFKTQDPRVKINELKDYQFLSGVNAIQYKQIESTSASTSNLTFSYKPPSSVIISRKMYIKYYLTLNFTGTNSLGNNLLNIGRSSGLKAWPLTSNCSAITLKINGEQVTNSQPELWWASSQRYQQYGLGQSTDNSIFPSYPDQSQQFEDVLVNGFARNPLARQGENAFNLPRGATVFYDVITNTPTSASVRCEVVEPCVVNPLVWGDKNDSPGLCSVQDLQITYTLSNGLQGIWSNSTIDGTNITGISVGISTTGSPSSIANPQLMFQEIQPDFTNPVVFDKPYLYPYCNVNVQSYDSFANVVAGGSAQQSVQNIQYGTVPKSLMIFVRERLSDTQAYPKYWSATQTFAKIESLSIQINGSSSLLAEANNQDLYNICSKNGYKDSYCAFAQDVGSVLVLELGSDLPLLDPSIAPGLVTNFNVQISNLRIKNTSNSTKNYTVVVCAMIDGIAAIKNNTMTLTTGLLSREQVLQAPLTDRPHSHTAYGLTGGGFFSNLASGFSKALDVGRNIYDVAKKVSPIVKTFLPQTAAPLSAIGLGRRKMKKMGRGILKKDGTGIYNDFDFRKKLQQSDAEDDSGDSEEEYVSRY